jgi:hypothetical protein
LRRTISQGKERKMAVRLTKAVKEEAAKRVARERLIPALVEQWKEAQKGMTALVRGYYMDFDWDHVESFREYMNWHDEIGIEGLPSDWRVRGTSFNNRFSLPDPQCVKIDFMYPSKRHYAECLPDGLKGVAMDILRPYMELYFKARQAYEDVERILMSVVTERQLEDVAPELVEFLPKTEREASKALVQIETVNRVRGFLREQSKAMEEQTA